MSAPAKLVRVVMVAPALPLKMATNVCVITDLVGEIVKVTKYMVYSKNTRSVNTSVNLNLNREFELNAYFLVVLKE